jgi:hypothetical protein
VAGGAGDEGFGAVLRLGLGVGGDEEVGRAGAAGEGFAEGKGVVGVVVDGVDGEAAGGAVGDDQGAVVWGDGGDAWGFAGGGGGDLAAEGEVEDADGVGAGVGDVGALAVGGDGDEVRGAMDADGVGDGVGGGVDDGDGVGGGVDGVDLVADGVDGEAGRVGADGENAVLAEIDEVEDGTRGWWRGRWGRGCGRRRLGVEAGPRRNARGVLVRDQCGGPSLRSGMTAKNRQRRRVSRRGRGGFAEVAERNRQR